MRKLLLVCTIISFLITAYCFLEYQLPYAQWSKVLSELKQHEVDNGSAKLDEKYMESVRWDIVGVQGTWWPMWILTLSQNLLMVVITFRYFSKQKRAANVEQQTAT